MRNVALVNFAGPSGISENTSADRIAAKTDCAINPIRLDKFPTLPQSTTSWKTSDVINFEGLRGIMTSGLARASKCGGWKPRSAAKIFISDLSLPTSSRTSLHGTSSQVSAVLVFACLCAFVHAFVFFFEFVFALVFHCLFVFVLVFRFLFLLLLVFVDCGRKDKCDAGFCAAVTVGRACSLVQLSFAGRAAELSGES